MEVCLDERANSYVRYFRRVGFLRPLAISVGPRSTKKMVQSEVSNEDDYEDYPARVSSTRAQRAVKDRQSPTVGPGKEFQKTKNSRQRFNGHNSETKRDIVMGPTAKMVTTHRATNNPIGKNLVT